MALKATKRKSSPVQNPVAVAQRKTPSETKAPSEIEESLKLRIDKLERANAILRQKNKELMQNVNEKAERLDEWESRKGKPKR